MAIRIPSKSKAPSTSADSKTEENSADIRAMYEIGDVFITGRELSQRWKLSERHICCLIAQARIPTFVSFGLSAFRKARSSTGKTRTFPDAGMKKRLENSFWWNPQSQFSIKMRLGFQQNTPPSLPAIISLFLP